MGATVDDLIRKIEELRQDINEALVGQVLSAQQTRVINGLSDIDKRLGLIQAGEFRAGNSVDPGKGFSGIRIVYPAVTYSGEEWNLVGLNNDVLQVGIRATDGKFFAGGGNVVIDSSGLLFANNQLSSLAFEDTLGNDDTISIYSDGLDNLVLANQTGNISDPSSGGIRLAADTSTHKVMYAALLEDRSLAERTFFKVFPTTDGGTGARLGVGNEIFLDGEGTGGGQTCIIVYPTTDTPVAPTASTEVNFYIRNNKFIIQFNDGGTVRYKYLDLTGVGVTWVHTTVAP